MRPLARLSIRHKLSAVTLFTSLVVLLLATVVFVSAELVTYRRMMLQELAALASIIAGNASAAVVFDDPATAGEMLATLAAKSSVVGARIYRVDGTEFARYDRSRGGAPGMRELAYVGEATGPRYELQLWRGYADMHVPILLEEEVVGGVAIRSDLIQLYAVINAYLGVAILVVALSIVVSWLLSSRLQSIIAQPIFALLDVMRRVSERNDYSLRLPKTRDDELGRLIDGFNDMLARVETHDASLRTAWREANAANRAKSEFLANMSHELRTPLNAILGFAELMRRQLKGPLGHPSYVEYAGDIYESGKHLLDVISDILDLSRIEAGQLKLDPVVIDVPQLARKALRLVAERAESAGLALTVDVAEDLPSIMGDERLVKQALLNLLSNAVKYTPRGGSVTLRAMRHPTSGVMLQVIDTGIGMAKTDLPRVFVPFIQVESSFSRRYEGTGLGLPLARSFVEAHGGKLELASELGRGTTATIVLPRRPPSGAKTKAVASLGTVAPELERAAN